MTVQGTNTMNWQYVPLEIAGGIDTKSDPKEVIEGRLVDVTDCTLAKRRNLQKRNGYSALTTTVIQTPTLIGSITNLAAPRMISEFNGVPICIDQGMFYVYNATLNGWEQMGYHESVKAQRFNIQNSPGTAVIQSGLQAGMSCAVSGNILCVVTEFSTVNAFSVAVWGAQIAIIDLSTNQLISIQNVLTAAQSAFGTAGPRITTLNSGVFGLTYGSGTNTISLSLITVSSGSVTIGAPTALFSDAKMDNTSGAFVLFHRSLEIATGGAYYLYRASNSGTDSIKAALVNSSGTVTASIYTATTDASVGTTGNTYMAQMYLDSVNNRLWCYWAESHTGSSPFNDQVFATVINSNLSSNIIGKTSVTSAPITYGYLVGAMVTVQSATQHTVWIGYEVANTNGIFLPITNGFYQSSPVTITASFGGSPAITPGTLGLFPIPHVYPVWGSTFIGPSPNNYWYGMFAQSIPSVAVTTAVTNPQIAFICNLSLGNLAANVCARLSYSQAAAFPSNGIKFYTGSQWVFPLGVDFISDVGTFNQVTNVAAPTYYVLDFNNVDCYKTQKVGNILVLNGGCPRLWDGNSLVEFDFHTFPQITNVTSSGSGSNINAGTYFYQACYVWFDKDGIPYWSQPSLPFKFTAGSTLSATNVYATGYPSFGLLGFAQKQPRLMIYRTNANGTFVIGAIQSLINASNAYGTGIIGPINDNTTDVSGNDKPYFLGGVLESEPPPCFTKMVARNNRLWIMSDEDPDNMLYSKAYDISVGLSFAGNFLSQRIDRKFGYVTALAEMDEKLVIFKQNGIAVMVGDGAVTNGTGSTLTAPQFLPTDAGCNSMSSVITNPAGVAFKSPKGLYLLDRSTTVNYFGQDVELYNSQTVRDSIIMPDRNEVRFISDSGRMLVYQYLFNQWYTFTNHNGIQMANINNIFYYLRTNGQIYQESQTSFLDNTTSYQWSVTLAWIKLAGQQSYQRIRRVAFLGNYQNGTNANHAIQVSAAYDYGTTFSTPVPFVLGSASSSGTFQFRERLPRQKCNAVQLLIQEVIDSGISGEYIDIENMSLELGVKGGINRLPAAQSTG